MTQPNGEQYQALTKALGVIALIECIDNLNRVISGFEIAEVFTPEGTQVLNEITKNYFDRLRELIDVEREILVIQRSQREP